MNFNKVILAGNLTRDPQLSYTPAQMSVCDFGLAINSKWKGKDGQDREETCFVDCRAFGPKADAINTHFHKGKPIFVEGKLHFSSWEKDGKKHSKLRVTVDQFQFVGPKEDGQPARQPARQPAQQQAPEPPDASFAEFDSAEDDGSIPF